MLYIFYIIIGGIPMAERRKKYNQLQQVLSLALLGAFLLFIFYLIAAGNEIVWLKAVLSVLIFLICAACLGLLYITREILRPRSIWMSLSAVSIAVCLLLSLLLHFPCPNPRIFSNPVMEDMAAFIPYIGL